MSSISLPERVECELYIDEKVEVIRFSDLHIPPKHRNQPGNQKQIEDTVDRILKHASDLNFKAVQYDSLKSSSIDPVLVDILKDRGFDLKEQSTNRNYWARKKV